jgi:hypothetical protein
MSLFIRCLTLHIHNFLAFLNKKSKSIAGQKLETFNLFLLKFHKFISQGNTEFPLTIPSFDKNHISLDRAHSIFNFIYNVIWKLTHPKEENNQTLKTTHNPTLSGNGTFYFSFKLGID